MQQETKDIIKKTLEDLIVKMGFSGNVEILEEKNETEDENENVVCNIATGTDSNFLIGQHGSNLQAIQHIARLMVRKQVPDKIRFTIDVNNYREQKNDSVIQQAKEAAAEAISERRAVIMQPMSTYERRIVHLELSKNSNIVTESVGEGEGRKIVVKPSSLIE